MTSNPSTPCQNASARSMSATFRCTWPMSTRGSIAIRTVLRSRPGAGHSNEGGCMSWHVKGTYFENCSCDSVCPCTTSVLRRPADTDRCRVVLAFHIDEVDIEIRDEVHEGMSEPAKLTNIPLPWNTTVTIAQATRSRVNAFGLEFDNTGKNGHAAPFSWAA